MSCTRPLKLFFLDSYYKPYYDIDFDTGELRDIRPGFERRRSKVCSAKVDHLEETDTGLWPVEDESVGQCKKVYRNWIFVPCGKCPGCRLDQSRVWANRLMCELPYHREDQCWFITLTYREHHEVEGDEIVPSVCYFDDDSQCEKCVRTLRKEHAQKFIKDLRNFCDRHKDGKKIRYYLSGEYGSRTKRPHYHAIIFGLPLDWSKLVYWSTTGQNFTLYRCPELEKIWSRGNVLVSSVSWATCAYVARYVSKKLGQTAFIYDKLGIEPEFSLMSRKPGIGYQYLLDHPECIEKGIHLSLPDGGRNFPAPRYFKSFTNVSECDILHTDLQNRQVDFSESVINTSDLADFSTYLEMQESCLSQALSRKERSGV